MAKVKIVNMKRFTISIVAIICILVVGIFLGSSAFSKKEFNAKTYSKNVAKYSDEILSEYEKSGMKERFKELYNKIQENATQIIFSNLTEDESSFEKGVDSMNKKLQNKQYEELDLAKDEIEFWVGDFKLDKTGKLVFTFKSKDIKPSWANELVKENVEIK